MALPPTIPTSFVPRPFASDGSRGSGFKYESALVSISYIILGIVFILAISVFIYERILLAEKISKDSQLLEAEQAIDLEVVENFLRTQNRLTSSKMLLEKHVAYSVLFESIGNIIPSTVRFTSLEINRDAEGVSRLDGTGVSKNFNALAVTSIALARDGGIKDAIFSKLKINQDNSVTFSFTAILDPEIVAFTP